MIKNKTPILMVSIVGTLVLTLVAINMTQYLRNPGGLVEIEAPNKEALEKVGDRDHAQVYPEGVTLQKMETSFGADESGAVKAVAIPDEPSIQIPNTRLIKPTFEPSTTAAHWYDEDSYQKVSASKNAGKREDPK